MDTITTIGGMSAGTVNRVRELLLQRFSRPPLAFVHSYGCQQNVSDGERLKGVLKLLGCVMADAPQQADVLLLNTCAVRENAESRVFGNVGALKALKTRNPKAVFILCGCMTQQQHVAEKLRRSYGQVDIVFGANAAHRLADLLLQALEKGGRVIDLSPVSQEIVEGVPVSRDQPFRAFLPVMQGCDNFCTYCVVPYVRGRERSRRMADILAEARQLIQDGCREITLLGQNVNSYGKGLDEEEDFPELLRRLNDLPGDFWIRFMTSHPKDCTRRLIDAIAACEKVCNHIHLPVQSGSDRILALMNRHYTARQYLELADYARGKIPGVSLTSDIIVGFPGETREDFAQTLDLVRRVRYTSLFTFIYSPRVGTKAAEMPDPMSAQEKSALFTQLLECQEQIGRSVHEAQVGRVLRVLANEKGKAPGTLLGRAESGIIVQFGAPESGIGQFFDVRVTQALNWAVSGETQDNANEGL